MAEQIKCTGDCINCNAAQRIYCAAQCCQMILHNQQVMLAQLAELREGISQAKTVAPIDETGTENDAGADNRASKKSRTSTVGSKSTTKKVKENELQ